MGQLIMPKHSGDAKLFKSILKFYFEKNEPATNDELIDYCETKLGRKGKDDSAQTKLAQLPAYFRFIEWIDPNNQRSPKRITESGKIFYNALEQENKIEIARLLLEAMENVTFGRNGHGVNSDSDFEPPNIAVRIALLLEYFKKEEYHYILDGLVSYNKPVFELFSYVKRQRDAKKSKYPTPKNPYVRDNKVLQILEELSFFEKKDDKYYINEDLQKLYLERLYNLKIQNTEANINYTNENIEIPSKNSISDFGKNIIYFGSPGSGKSFIIAKKLENIDLKYQKRITFHPEYDNASFVGCYKPITIGGKDIIYEFVPQIFTNIYVDACNDPDNQYFLIIEELNRGNCAEIFGELFQLLDRDKNYKITPSNELINYLNKNIYDSIFYSDGNMTLPDNLNIVATMNTSDQSLFPMDSAFKRRWEWIYVPINYDNNSDNTSALYKIDIGENVKFSWISFIEKINIKIRENPNLGMDKFIGNYFVKPDSENNISLENFIYKVMFYLWNDVFKDEPMNSIFGEKTYQDFFPINTNGKELVRKIFLDLNVISDTENNEVNS